MFAVSTNLLKEAESLTEYWSPRVVAEVNDQYVKVAKIRGQFVWHAHEDEDELFYILKGNLRIEYRDHVVDLGVGDVHVIPKGVEHNPIAAEECLVALVETKTTLHTGNVQDDKTKSVEDQLEG
ncbi:cupin domain-containing protein [Terasakiella sp. A23]|uniref:cupin domain-containing protein n=1 Tax=Terasakiella sp. FCG-A23 TaxID=3080561 RepID=UPI0029559DAE|nr:cupin domain-containing protein [Terasakiella sp. A23]MDV7338499.1 cupin domain-containing protein [Terasakiella sp. A23]